MQQFQVRTDLALEATESVRKQASGQMRGISIDEYDIMDDEIGRASCRERV